MYSIYLKETAFRGSFEKYSRARHFTVKGCQITKFCKATDLKEPWKSALKKVFFHKMFDESHTNAGKKKKQEMTKQGFQRAIYRKANNCVTKICHCFFSLVYITHVDKYKYLIFMKFENTRQIKCIFKKFC